MRQIGLIAIPILFFIAIIFFALKLHRAPIAEARCVKGSCPLELHESDNGKTFVYGIATRFGILLDGDRNPKQHMACDPSGIIGAITNIPSTANPPYYWARFETLAPGSCILANDHYAIKIVVE